MRLRLIQIVCDLCGTVQEFEAMQHGLFANFATMDLPEKIERHGWRNEPAEGGGRFRRRDVCGACVKATNRTARKTLEAKA